MRCLGPSKPICRRAARWIFGGAAALGVWISVARAEESWVKVATEHFTILTPAGESVARKWAIELEQFRRGLQSAVPVPVERLRPVTVVLFKNDRAMEPFAPLEKGKPVKIGGFFVRSNDINTIMLSLARTASETRHVIFHEAVHWHLSAREGIMPLWLSEGLAEVYATFELPDAKSYAFGGALDEHVALLQRESLLPLPKLLGIGRDSLLYNEGARTGIFYAQSWAFVHFLFYGENSPGRAAVTRYLELLPHVSSPDDAFLTAFGADYATLEKQLRSYITGGRYRKHVYERATDDIARHLRTGPATLAEVELAKGSLLLGTRAPEDAEPFLGRAAELAPSDSRAWELLGHIAVGRKDFSRAFSVLSQAAATGSTSYLVYHNLGVSRLPELAQPLMPGVALDAAAMDAAAADFRKAIALAPGHVASYEGLAGMMQGAATFVASDLDLLVRGVMQSPGNTMIEAGIAAAEVRAGRATDGRARLERLCARHPTATDAGMVFARRLLENETLQSEIDAINRLSMENRLDEVIALTDRALTRSLDPAARALMENVRRRTGDFQTIGTAVIRANQGDLAAAKQSLTELLNTEPELTVAKEAQRILQEIAKQEERNRTEH